MESVKIIKALANFQKDCPELDLNSEVKVKTKTGGSYSFRYADLPYIMETIQPTLSVNELVPLFDFPENVIRLTIYHTSGETVTSQLPLKLSASPQENGSLITYYRRYLICSLLNITADKDDDGNTFEQQDRKVSSTPPKPKIKPTITDAQFKKASNSTDPIKIQAMIEGCQMSEPQKKDLTQLIIDIEINQAHGK